MVSCGIEYILSTDGTYRIEYSRGFLVTEIYFSTEINFIVMVGMIKSISKSRLCF